MNCGTSLKLLLYLESTILQQEPKASSNRPKLSYSRMSSRPKRFPVALLQMTTRDRLTHHILPSVKIPGSGPVALREGRPVTDLDTAIARKPLVQQEHRKMGVPIPKELSLDLPPDLRNIQLPQIDMTRADTLMQPQAGSLETANSMG